jgi:uncharacterized membrane protein (DUF373 family)
MDQNQLKPCTGRPFGLYGEFESESQNGNPGLDGMEPEKRKQLSAGAHHVQQTVVPILESADAVVYAVVGLVFLVAALGMLGYSLSAFPANLHSTGFALAVVSLVNDLLLVMIIMEVLRTVISYLQEHGTSLRPFLFIAAISATRRILAIGAQMNVAGGTLSPDKFREAMIDLSANAGAILAIALALFLLARNPATTEMSV